VVLALTVVNELLTEYGVPTLTSSRYKEIFDFPVLLYYKRAGLDLERHDFHGISEKFCSRFEERLHRFWTLREPHVHRSEPVVAMFAVPGSSVLVEPVEDCSENPVHRRHNRKNPVRYSEYQKNI
jgi:hypothetical protein